ncbi:hypothetical protein [Kribbella koreensis]
MTDEGQGGTEWVPRFGMLEVQAERAELIRGLFELAAFVADHPELSLPFVSAVGLPIGESFSEEMREVEAAALALGVSAAFQPGGGYSAARRVGGPRVELRFTARPIPTGEDYAAPVTGEA